MQSFIINTYVIFRTNSDFLLCKFCLVSFCYNLILVLCPYRSLFEKKKYKLYAWQYKSALPSENMSNKPCQDTILLCQNWQLMLFQRYFKFYWERTNSISMTQCVNKSSNRSWIRKIMRKLHSCRSDILTLKRLGGVGVNLTAPLPRGFSKNVSSRERVKPGFLWLLILP